MQRIVPPDSAGFEQVRGVHRAAAGGAGADHRVDLVDEQHRVGQLLELGDDLPSAAPRNRRDSGCRRAARPCRASRSPLRRARRARRPRRSCARGLPRSRSCRRRDRPHRAGCSSSGGSRIWMVRSTSAARPISGSTRPSLAFSLRLTVNWSSALSPSCRSASASRLLFLGAPATSARLSGAAPPLPTPWLM